MPTSVTMPALGESVTEGTVTRWLKQEGEQVEVDEPLLEVSTDKVDTEIPSPAAGVLSKILVAEDETVEVGAELAVIGGGDGGGGGSPAARRGRAAKDPGGGGRAGGGGCRAGRHRWWGRRWRRLPRRRHGPRRRGGAGRAGPGARAGAAGRRGGSPAGARVRLGRQRLRGRRGHPGHDAGAGRERHRGHRHPLAQVGR